MSGTVTAPIAYVRDIGEREVAHAAPPGLKATMRDGTPEAVPRSAVSSEGTGAALAFHLIEASTCLLREMATFREAGVSDKE